MSHHLAAPAESDRPARTTAPAPRDKPPVAASVLLLAGGVLGVMQLLLPWFSAGKKSSSGWNQYYGTARSGAVELISGYAVIVGAAAALVMLISAVTLLTQRSDYTAPRRTAAIAALVALAAGLWWLILGPTPDTAQFTAGWYAFLLAGVLGLAGVAASGGRVSMSTVMTAGAGLAAVATLITPMFAGTKAAVSGWRLYYGVAHHGAAELTAAYGILVVAVVGVALLVLAALPAARRATPVLIAGVVIAVCAALWVVTGAAPDDMTPAFGWYLSFFAALLAIFAALKDGALGIAFSLAPTLMLLAGIIGTAQFALPWFGGASGWTMYYSQAHEGWTQVSSAYVSLLTLLAGVVILVTGIAAIARPALLTRCARIVRIAGWVLLGAVIWWMILGPETFADTVGSGGFGWYLLALTVILALSAAAIPLSGPHLTFDKASFMAVFLGLPLAIFILFVLSPFVQAFYYSMTDWKGFSKTMNFTGFHNYVKLFKDDQFRHAMLNSITLGIVVPLVTIVLALAIASMVTVGGPSRGPVRGIKASSFYRVISFFPYAVPAIVIGIIWSQVYNPTAGILNSFLTSIGLDQFDGFNWLWDRSTAMPASMFVIIWSFVGFYAVLFIASIKGVSAEVYEAARLDGAGRFRTAVGITIPLIRDTIQTAYIYLGIAALDAFVYMMALNPSGGSGDSTLTMSQDLYLTAFKRQNQFGYGTAMGVVLAIVTLLFATLVFAVNHWAGRDKVKKVAR